MRSAAGPRCVIGRPVRCPRQGAVGAASQAQCAAPQLAAHLKTKMRARQLRAFETRALGHHFFVVCVWQWGAAGRAAAAVPALGGSAGWIGTHASVCGALQRPSSAPAPPPARGQPATHRPQHTAPPPLCAPPCHARLRARNAPNPCACALSRLLLPPAAPREVRTRRCCRRPRRAVLLTHAQAMVGAWVWGGGEGAVGGGRSGRLGSEWGQAPCGGESRWLRCSVPGETRGAGWVAEGGATGSTTHARALFAVVAPSRPTLPLTVCDLLSVPFKSYRVCWQFALGRHIERATLLAVLPPHPPTLFPSTPHRPFLSISYPPPPQTHTHKHTHNILLYAVS